MVHRSTKNFILALLFARVIVCLSTQKNVNGCKTEENEVSFMKRCYCKPGWESSVPRPGIKCDKPIHQVGDCSCGAIVGDRVVLSDDPVAHNEFLNSVEIFNVDSEKRIRCYNLCRSTPEVGIPISHPGEWKDNLFWKQLGFYTKELRICSLNLRHTHMRQRLNEFSISYNNYAFLDNIESLGRLIEYGAGGYTQTRNLLEHHAIKVDHVTLVDPLVQHYGKLEGCSYATAAPNLSRLRVNSTFYPTTVLNTSVESFGHTLLGEDVLNTKPLGYAPPGAQLYDTIIVMNVMVYARNAFQFLETLYRSLKPGGLLLFHDRFFDDPVRSSKCKTSGFLTNMIQVRSEFINYFLSEEFFERAPAVYFNTEQNEDQRRRSREWCPYNDEERGVFAALRKKAEPSRI